MKNRICTLAMAVASVAAAQAPSVETLKQAATEMVDGRRQLAQRIVDSLFSFAELGYQEYESSAYLCALLEREGFQVTRSVAGMPTAFVASWGSGKPVIDFCKLLVGNAFQDTDRPAILGFPAEFGRTEDGCIVWNIHVAAFTGIALRASANPS